MNRTKLILLATLWPEDPALPATKAAVQVITEELLRLKAQAARLIEAREEITRRM